MVVLFQALVMAGWQQKRGRSVFVRQGHCCAGQVQDVGLIFLSAMATSIAAMSTAAGFSAQEALGTTLVTLVIATFVVGALIVLVGEGL